MTEPNTILPEHVDWQRHAIFLDFDGTLTPIVDRPEDVVVSERTRRALSRLGDLTDGALAVISGRALADLERHLAPTVCAVSGSHGLEIRQPGCDGKLLADAEAILKPVLEEISAFAARNDLLVENKPGAVTVHYRGRPEMADACRALVDRIAGDREPLRAMHGNMVSEVALAGIDKGAALENFMNEIPFRGRTPIMAGDDVTDEDAFRAAHALDGFGIKIGPGPTVAAYRAADIDAFLAWLSRQTDLQ